MMAAVLVVVVAAEVLELQVDGLAAAVIVVVVV